MFFDSCHAGAQTKILTIKEVDDLGGVPPYLCDVQFNRFQLTVQLLADELAKLFKILVFQHDLSLDGRPRKCKERFFVL